MLGDICSICAQIIPELAPSEKWNVIVNKMRFCPIKNTNHKGHKKCFEDAEMKQIQSNMQTYCCDCKVHLTNEKIIDEHSQFIENNKTIIKIINVVTAVQAFSQKIRDMIVKEFNDELIKVYKVFICKKCNHHTHLMRGQVNYKQLDRYGKSISEDAAINCNLNQIECKKCKENYCFKCKDKPYHLGYTCEDFEKYIKNRKCRFCRITFGQKQQDLRKIGAFDLVCNQIECIKLMDKSCEKVHQECSHLCGGTSTETTCLPCLDPQCVSNYDEAQTYGVNSEEHCMICYSQVLGQAPVVQLNCKHLFHQHCIDTLLSNKHSGNRISFGYLNCPSCGVEMSSSTCSIIQDKLVGEKYFKDCVYNTALNLANREKLFDEEDFKNRPEFQNNQKEYAMIKLAMYECFQCKSIYCGGRRDCELDMSIDNFLPQENILCLFCTAENYSDQLKPCETHGTEYLDYKCQFCCTPAKFYCFNATSYCEECHTVACSAIPKLCKGNIQGCSYKGNHPPNGTPYHAGCKMCKIQEEELKIAQQARNNQILSIQDEEEKLEQGK
eukprot:403339326